MEKYFEIPVSVFNGGELEDIYTFYAKGTEESARLEASKHLSEIFDGKDYDYDVIEISESEYKTSNGDRLEGDPDEVDPMFDGVQAEPAALPPKSMEDEMEDLQDRYYALTDKLNAIPVDSIPDKSEASNFALANKELTNAKEFFDQYDMFGCREALNRAESHINELIPGQPEPAEEAVESSEVLFDPYDPEKSGLNGGEIVELLEEVYYCDECDLDPEQESEYETAGLVKKDGDWVVPAGTTMTLIFLRGPGGGWPCFDINGSEFDFAGDAFKVKVVSSQPEAPAKESMMADDYDYIKDGLKRCNIPFEFDGDCVFKFDNYDDFRAGESVICENVGDRYECDNNEFTVTVYPRDDD